MSYDGLFKYLTWNSLMKNMQEHLTFPELSATEVDFYFTKFVTNSYSKEVNSSNELFSKYFQDKFFIKLEKLETLYFCWQQESAAAQN